METLNQKEEKEVVCEGREGTRALVFWKGYLHPYRKGKKNTQICEVPNIGGTKNPAEEKVQRTACKRKIKKGNKKAGRPLLLLSEERGAHLR